MVSAKSGRSCTFLQRKSKRTKDSTFLTHRFFLNLQLSPSATEEDWGTGERNKWERFLDFVFFQNSEKKKIPNAKFFLRIQEKRIQKTFQWSLSSSAECNTRFDLLITAVCETHELQPWEYKGLNHVCSKPVTWVGQRHRGRHSFAPSALLHGRRHSVEKMLRAAVFYGSILPLYLFLCVCSLPVHDHRTAKQLQVSQSIWSVNALSRNPYEWESVHRCNGEQTPSNTEVDINKWMKHVKITWYFSSVCVWVCVQNCAACIVTSTHFRDAAVSSFVVLHTLMLLHALLLKTSMFSLKAVDGWTAEICEKSLWVSVTTDSGNYDFHS